MPRVDDIQIRRGSAASAAVAGAVFDVGEPGYEQDTGLFKIGDGLTHWTLLPVIGAPHTAYTITLIASSSGAAARAVLGLGTVAVLDVGTSDGEVVVNGSVIHADALTVDNASTLNDVEITGDLEWSGTLYAGNAQTLASGANYIVITNVAGQVDITLIPVGTTAGKIPQLDGTGKIPTSLLPAAVLGGLNYQGTWNATTNTPTIPAAASGNKGWYYKVATAGTTTIDGINDWKISDLIVSNGATWDKIDNTDQVTSVSGRQGAVTLTTADIGGLGSSATHASTDYEPAVAAGTTGQFWRGDKTFSNTLIAPAVGTSAFRAQAFSDSQTAAIMSAERSNGTQLFGVFQLGTTMARLYMGSATNVVIGANAYNSTSTAGRNIAIGDNTLLGSTSGQFNVAMGYDALRNTSSGATNFGLGDSCFRDNTTGGRNVGVGQSSGLLNTTGSDNIYIGYASGGNTATGISRNVGVGTETLKNATNQFNVAVGYQALTALTSGSVNTAIGDSALSACTTGGGNVAIGQAAGLGQTSNGSNVLIGYAAAYQGNHLNCVHIGYLSATGAFNQNQSVCIGASTAFGANLSNTVQVGFSSSVTASGTVALGQGAAATATDAVAIGRAVVNSVASSVRIVGAPADAALADNTSNILILDANNVIRQITAANLSSVAPLFDHYADGGNSGVLETDLVSDTIAASQLVGNGDKLEAEYGGVFVSSGTATRQIKLYFGGMVIFDTGLLTISLASAWTMYLSVVRVSSTVIRYMISLTTEGAALAAYTAVGELTGLALSATNVLKVTGQAAGIGAASNDIVVKMSNCIYTKKA